MLAFLDRCPRCLITHRRRGATAKVPFSLTSTQLHSRSRSPPIVELAHWSLFHLFTLLHRLFLVILRDFIEEPVLDFEGHRVEQVDIQTVRAEIALDGDHVLLEI